MVEPKDSGQITKGKIDEAITALKDLKPKERDSVSDRDAIRKLRRYIEKVKSDNSTLTVSQNRYFALLLSPVHGRILN